MTPKFSQKPLHASNPLQAPPARFLTSSLLPSWLAGWQRVGGTSFLVNSYWFPPHLLYCILSSRTPPISFLLFIRIPPLKFWCRFCANGLRWCGSSSTRLSEKSLTTLRVIEGALPSYPARRLQRRGGRVGLWQLLRVARLLRLTKHDQPGKRRTGWQLTTGGLDEQAIHLLQLWEDAADRDLDAKMECSTNYGHIFQPFMKRVGSRRT